MDYAAIFIITFAALLLTSFFILIFDISAKRNAGKIVLHEIKGIFAVYIFMVLALTVIFRTPGKNVGTVLTPFSDIAYAIENAGGEDIRFNVSLIAGNVALFVPYGILAPEALTKNLLIDAAGGALLSCSIETLQLLTKRGVFDVNDIIYNTLGALMGLAIYKLLEVVLRRIFAKKTGGAPL